MLGKSLKKVLISGAGPAGLALAGQLGKLDIPYRLIEKKSELTCDGAGIALPANAMRALRHMGLYYSVMKQAHQVKEICYAEPSGDVLSVASLRTPPLDMELFVALHRRKLHEILQSNVHSEVHLNTSVRAMRRTQEGVRVSFDNDTLSDEEFSLVVGADGLHSSVRRLAFAQDQPLVDLGVTNWRWTCAFPTSDLAPTYLLGEKDAFMAYPIGQDEVYCYAQVFDPDAQVFDKRAQSREAIFEKFSAYKGVVSPLLERLPKNEGIIPGRLRSVPRPLFSTSFPDMPCALIGDASSACSPMLQQGAACAFEDVVVLSQMLANFHIDEALVQYEKNRQDRVNWVVSASDGPMKMLSTMTSFALFERNEAIRQQGPFNVQGWRKLMATDPLGELPEFIRQAKAEEALLSSKKGQEKTFSKLSP